MHVLITLAYRGSSTVWAKFRSSTYFGGLVARIFTVVSTKMYINKNTSFAVASALYGFVAFFLPPPSLPHQTKREVSRFSALLTSTQISMTTQGQRQVLLTGPYKCQSYCQRFLSDCLTHVLPIPVHTFASW